MNRIPAPDTCRATLSTAPAAVPVESHVARVTRIAQVIPLLVTRCSCIGRWLLLGKGCGLPCLLVESRQQADGGFQRDLCPLRARDGLCILCRVCLSRGGRVRNFCDDRLHILADIRDLLRQFLDVPLQIISANMLLEDDLRLLRSCLIVRLQPIITPTLVFGLGSTVIDSRFRRSNA